MFLDTRTHKKKIKSITNKTKTKNANKKENKRQQTEDKSEWPFNDDFFIILNMALGGNMGGTINDDIFEQDVVMYVDYVRVYQKKYPEL